MAKEVDTWSQLMSVAVTMPGVKVNREKFLTKVLRRHCNAEKLDIALKGMPANVVSQRLIDNLAISVINWHTAKATGASVVTGLGGFMTIPADIIQYYWNMLILSQKLTYLYGFPDLCDDDGNLPEDSQNLLTVFIAIMMGATIAGKGLQYIIERAAKQATRTIPEIAVAETLYYPLIKQTTKWIGKRLGRNSLTKSIRKSIPILGGLLSGTITFATFRPGAFRLMNELKRETVLLQKKEMEFVP